MGCGTCTQATTHFGCLTHMSSSVGGGGGGGGNDYWKHARKPLHTHLCMHASKRASMHIPHSAGVPPGAFNRYGAAPVLELSTCICTYVRIRYDSRLAHC
eukprot:GHVU01124299.1.p2 GENE.GHVU01124299.1~~GHVU01124299.1.p2  ORF type:complete len:100 (+),score=10.98 GHVU01124299.1:205-504(+)